MRHLYFPAQKSGVMFLTSDEICLLLNRPPSLNHLTISELKLFQLDGPELFNRGALYRMILEKRSSVALENLDREIIESNDIIGKGPVLLCFWSSCCKSAVMQIEAFTSLYEKYKDEHFVMLAIATDDEKTVAKVKPYVKSMNFKFPVVYDTDGNVARTYYTFDVPFSVLIDKSGKITYTHLGYMKGDEIEMDKMIIGLLKD